MGAEPVAVLSEAFWKRRFGADPGVLGRTLVLSGQPTRVVGVMPAAFDFLDDRGGPLGPGRDDDALGARRARDEQLRRDRPAPARRLDGGRPGGDRRDHDPPRAGASRRRTRGKIVEPMPMHEFVTGPVRPALLVLLGRRAPRRPRGERQRGGAAPRPARRARRASTPCASPSARARGTSWARSWPRASSSPLAGGGPRRRARGLGPRRAPRAGAGEPAPRRRPSRSTPACSPSRSASPWWRPSSRPRLPGAPRRAHARPAR